MNFFLALLAWIVIGILLGIALWLMVAKAVFWFMAVMLLGFIVAVWQFGCKAH
jgi:hypothetical protein